MERNLEEAYQRAHYYVDGFNTPIKIGKHSLEADAFCEARGASQWAYITAWNPLSVVLSTAENKKRNDDLLSDLEGYEVLTGRGQDPEGQWLAEESFFIAAITPTEAIKLGKKYVQRAIVVGSVKSEAKLIIIPDFAGK